MKRFVCPIKTNDKLRQKCNVKQQPQHPSTSISSAHAILAQLAVGAAAAAAGVRRGGATTEQINVEMNLRRGMNGWNGKKWFLMKMKHEISSFSSYLFV